MELILGLTALIMLVSWIYEQVNAPKIAQIEANQKAAAEAAKIELMKNHPEVWDRLVEEDERKREHKREKRDKIVSVAGPIAVGVLQKLLTKK